MLLLSKVREFDHFQCISGRPCEAVWGHGRPGSSHWLRDLPEPIRGARPHTASQIRPHTASHRLGLTQFVMWSVWANQRGPIWEAEFSLTDSRQCSPILGAVWLISRLNALLRPESDLWGRSDSQICEAVGVRARPLTRKSCDLSESPIGLTDLRVRSASHGLTRPHRFESLIGLPQLAGRESPILGLIRLLCPVEVRLARGSDSHGRPAVGGRSDSQICEADRTLRSDSLTDLTLWQIWQIRLILAKLSDVP